MPEEDFSQFSKTRYLDLQNRLLEETQSKSKLFYRLDPGGTEKITEVQIEMLERVIKDEILLDPTKDHKMVVKVHGADTDRFTITIDNEKTFYVARSESNSDSYIIIQDKIRAGTLLSNLKAFFRGIANFFYKPTFRDPKLKQRTSSKAVKQDYRALRKALEAGQSWLKGKPEEKAKRDLINQVGGTIKNMKLIERALNKKNQKNELALLAEKFAKNIKNLKDGQSFTIPTGYMNKNGALEPIMVRFYRTEGKTSVEIFSDAVDTYGKVPAAIIKEFNAELTETDYADLLKLMFAPLLAKELGGGKLEAVVKPSETFGVLFDEKVQKSLDELGAQTDRPAGEARVEEKREKVATPLVSLSYEAFLKSLEKKMGDKWIDTTSADQKSVSTSGTPAGRIAKWFSLLVDDKEKFTKNEKLNLLFDLTHDWVEDRFKQISAKQPDSVQLEVYEECYGQIQHIKAKLAVAINEGHSLDPETGIPSSLRKQEEKALKKIEKLRGRVRAEAVEVTGKFLEQKHSDELGIPVFRTVAESAPEVRKGAPPLLVGPEERLDRNQWRKDWAGSLQELSEQLSPENLRKNQAQKIFLQLGEALKVAGVEESPEKILNDIFPNDEADLDALEQVVAAILIKTGFAEQVLADVLATKKSALIISPEELASIVTQMILCPHLVPNYSGETMCDKGSETLIQFFRKVMDPNASYATEVVPAYQSLRTLLSLRNLVPKTNIEETFEKLLTDKAEVYLQSQLELGKKDLEYKIKYYQEEIQKSKEKNNQADVEKHESLMKFYEEVSAAGMSLEEQLEIMNKWSSDATLDKSVKSKVNKGILKLESQKTYYDYLKSHVEDEAFITILDAMKTIETTPLDSFNKADAEKGIEEFNGNLAGKVGEITTSIQLLKAEAAVEQDPVKKRELYEEVKQDSLRVLKMLPPPGTEGALGVPSIWTNMPKEQRMFLANQVHELEHLVWESQMKLAYSGMNGKERFLLVKAQAIRQAIIREEVNETQQFVAKVLTEIYLKDNQVMDKFGFIQAVPGENRLKFEWHKLQIHEVGMLDKLIREEAPELTKVLNPAYLILDNYTLDVGLVNQLLTQDLTSCLSENAEMEEDLLAVYHFIVRDQNRGNTEKIDLPANEVERWEKYATGIARAPFLYDSRFASISIDGLLEQMPDASQKKEIKTVLSHLEKGEFYFRTASDPDFTIYSSNPTLGITYFQSNPDTLLEQYSLDLAIDRDKVEVLGDHNQIVAHVVANGHKDFAFSPDYDITYTDQERQLLIRLKKPFLPVVNNDEAETGLFYKDFRTHCTFEVWMEYIQEKSGEETLSIPPQVLQQLFQIRQDTGYIRSKEAGTSYTPDTAVGALVFITNPNNLRYLEHDYVQQFLEESLFGPFILQQAFLEHPDLMAEQFSLLADRLEDAKREGNLQAIGYLSNLVTQLEAHSKFTQRQLTGQGYFSGVINGSLPFHLNKPSGAFYGIFTYLNGHKGSEKLSPLGSEETEGVDPGQTIQPLAYRMKKVNECLEILSELNMEVSGKEGGMNPVELYFGEERKIDSVTNLDMKKQLYSHAMERYRLDYRNGTIFSLETSDIRNILSGYLLLSDPTIKGGIPSQQHDLVSWVRDEVMPVFHSLPKEDREFILTNLANQQLRRQKLQEITKGAWEPEKNNQNVFKLSAAGKEISLNLTTMDITGAGLKKKGVEVVWIPERITKRADVQQALKSDRIQVDMVEEPGGVKTYSWEENGQKFSIVDVNGKLTIKREILDGKLKGKYLFNPVNVPHAAGNGEALLAENGIWHLEGEKGGAFIFSGGVKLPTPTDHFIVKFSNENLIQNILSPDGLRMSRTAAFDAASPVQFAENKQLLTLIGEDKKPAELRLKGSELSLKRKDDAWIGYDGSSKLGRLKYPQNESKLVATFGEHWDRYVIPVEAEMVKSEMVKGAVQKTVTTEMQYILLPYRQVTDSRGKLAVDHASLDNLPHIEILREARDGTIQGSVSSELYLAHRLVAQASQTKNPTMARQLLMEAQRRLSHISSERPPSDPAELNSLKNTLLLISENPLSLERAPRPETITAALRLSLTVRRLRKMSSDQGFNTLAQTPNENFEELESISKLYEAYRVMEKSGSYAMFRKEGAEGKLHKTLLKLDDREKMELTDLSYRALRELGSIPKMSDYFGTTGRLVTRLEMDQPETVDPNFFLALIRAAKPVDKGVDIKDVSAPLPLNTLLENFWSYFISIKTGGVTPEELTFLYEDSLIPPARSIEEEDRLKSVDKQARQFLLSISSLQGQFGGEIKPIDLAKESVKGLKEAVQEMGDAELFSDVLGQLKPSLQSQFNAILTSVDEINVHVVGKKVGGKEIEFPDAAQLTREIKSFEVMVVNFTESLAQAVADGERLVKEHKSAYWKLSGEKTRLEKSLNALKEAEAEVPEIQEKNIQELEQSLEEAEIKFNEYAEKEVRDPITETNIKVSDIAKGQYEETLDFDRLRKVSQQTIQMKNDLQNGLESINDMTVMLEMWLKMEELTVELETAPYKSTDWFELPEKGRAKDALGKMLQEEKAAFGVKEGLSLVNQIGIKKAYRLGADVKKYAEIQDKIARTEDEEEKSELKQQINGTLLGKFELFGKPLGALVFAAGAQHMKKPITVEGAKRGVELPPEISGIRYHPIAAVCFTEKELDEIEAGLAKMDPLSRQTLLQKLASALNRNEALVSAQTGLERNTKDVNNTFERRFREGEKPAPATSEFNLANLIRDSKFEKIDTYYTGNRASPEQRDSIENAHQVFVKDLIELTLPDTVDSLYAKDLKKGFESLEKNNPLPLAATVGINEIELLEESLEASFTELSHSVAIQREGIVAKLKAIPLTSLSKPIQRIRLSNGTDEELLEAALKDYRNGAFATENLEDLDEMLSSYQIDHTRQGALKGFRFNAMSSLQELYRLRSQRAEQVIKKNQYYNKLNDIAHFKQMKDVEGHWVFQEIEGSLMHYVKMSDVRDAEEKIKAIESSWMRESSKIRDLVDRCQSTRDLENLPGKLMPHARKIIYLQNRLGIVLRPNQLETLSEIIENPALLKQLRMGLGKTSVILPFALEILASDGFFPIGMVPKALFDTNFKEMDETTRLVFELAGNQFLFSRGDAPQPFSLPILHKISQKCMDVLNALDKGQYILTTIESKASLDDKINEIQLSQSSIMSQIQGLIDEESEESKLSIQSLYAKAAEHQIALDNLLRVKAVFEHGNTRVIIDEADQVARANYAVNSEIGIKEIPDASLRDAVATIFDILRDGVGLEELRGQIYENNQFTLNKDEVDAHLKTIGKHWLERNRENLPVEFDDPILEWCAGDELSVELKGVEEPFLTQLKVMRRGLNSSLRGALGLKIGLSADWDPTHNAVGVPASQGITSKTTKFSDPLMQLSLTQLIAMYKPQGEAFLKSATPDVIDSLESKMKDVKNENEKELYTKGIDKLKKLLENEKEGIPPVYTEELKGHDSLNVFLRQRFSEQAALRKLIYVSSNQISRPVQHALRGCNVIGLTGTATRNTEHVIKSTGHHEGMDSIEKTGRESTAEVIYRLAKAMPKGLKTPVNTYSLNFNEALKQFKGFAKKDSGYNFLVNQAGACDQLKLEEIINELHTAEGRPIVSMFISNEGSFKGVLINGNIKKLETLTPDEKEEVMENGFYYYHTPHVRGTHFDIPTGSKGALLLSPTVNANDRDQAAYRARELGEGHTVELFISEKQQQELAALYTDGDTAELNLSHVLKAHHIQTQKDEAKEDLAAYKLHLQGLLTLAADRALEKIHIRETAREMVKWQDENRMESNLTKLSARARVFDVLQKFFVQDSGNDAYHRLLDKEIYQGGQVPTKEYLETLILAEIKRADRLIGSLNQEVKEEKTAIEEIEHTKAQLENELENLDTIWGTIKYQLPEKASASPAAVETAETEAEEEAQEEQETTSETAAELQRVKRGMATRSVLSELDEELLKGIKPDFTGRYLGVNQQTALSSLDTLGLPNHFLLPGWNSTTAVSKRLEKELQGSLGGVLPDMRLIAVQKGGRTFLTAADAYEGNLASGASSYFLDPENVGLLKAYTIVPTYDNEGNINLRYGGTANYMKEMKEEFENDQKVQAEALFTMIYLGLTQVSGKDWKILEDYWTDKIDDNQRESIQSVFVEKVGKKIPAFIEKAAKHLWKKPVAAPLSLGKKEEITKIIDLVEAQQKFNDYLDLQGNVYRQYEKWKEKNVDDSILPEFEQWANIEYKEYLNR